MLTITAAARADDIDTLYEQGQAAFEAKQFAEARVKFAAVWAQRRSFDVAAVLAQAELQLGQNANAAQHLAYSLAHFPVSAGTDVRKKIEAGFAEARAKVGEVKVEVSPPSAAVKVNGRVFTEADRQEPIFVEPGAVSVEASAPSYLPAKRDVQVDKAGEVKVTLALAKDPAGADGAGGPRKEVLIGGAALGGASILAGAVMLGVSAAKLSEGTGLRDDVQASQGRKACMPSSVEPRCKAQVDALSLSDALGNAGAWLLLGGAAVGATTVIYAIVTRAPSAPPPVQAGFFWTSEGGGAIVRTRF
jgi:hypothetical protein